MSKSKANELLQQLHARLSANWKGKEHFTAEQAVEMCREIINEYDNDNGTCDTVVRCSADNGEQ